MKQKVLVLTVLLLAPLATLHAAEPAKPGTELHVSPAGNDASGVFN